LAKVQSHGALVFIDNLEQLDDMKEFLSLKQMKVEKEPRHFVVSGTRR